MGGNKRILGTLETTSLAARKKRRSNNMKKWDRLKIAQKGIAETQKIILHFNKTLTILSFAHNFRVSRNPEIKGPEWDCTQTLDSLIHEKALPFHMIEFPTNRIQQVVVSAIPLSTTSERTCAEKAIVSCWI